MNDYLHNLVARTLQLAPVVRPRLPSLFEPMAAGQAVNNSLPPETHEDGTAAGPVPGVFRTTVRPPDKEPPVKFEIGSQPTTGNVNPLNANLKTSHLWLINFNVAPSREHTLHAGAGVQQNNNVPV